MKLNQFILLFVFVLLSISGISQNKIERIEPPNWWVGMKNTELQLMVYGDKIGDFNPTINYDGITLHQVVKVKNPNYLFIDLSIAPETNAGKFDIQFQKAGQTVETHSYELLAREPGSAERTGFNNSDVMYLITPDRFANGNPRNDEIEGMHEKLNRSFKGGRHGGDIEGIDQHLEYIKDLGFTAIWLNPLLENDQKDYSYHGYSTTDYYKIDARYGSNESYQTLARKAKAMGIKMIMDIIVNHCGSEHWWMNDLPTDDWINFNEGTYVQTNHRKTVIQDPHVSEFDRTQMTDGWFVPTMPDLNQRNPLLATYLIQNSIWWIEYAELAGIRMDTYPYPHMYFMTDWTKAIMDEYPDFNIVGEEWFSSPSIVSYWQRGKINPNGYTSELRSVMDFPVQEALRTALTAPESWGSGWINLYEMLGMDFEYADPDNLVTFPDNHDMDRFYTQVGEDLDLFKLGLSFILTTRGIPQLYYGTEVLMGNSDAPGDHGVIRTDFPGGWEGDPVNARTGEGLTEKQIEAKAYIKQLLNWRKDAKVIHDGKLTHFLPNDGVYVYFRYNETDKVMVLLNKNATSSTVPLAVFKEITEGIKYGKDVLSGKQYRFGETIEVPAKAALILELK